MEPAPVRHVDGIGARVFLRARKAAMELAGSPATKAALEPVGWKTEGIYS